MTSPTSSSHHPPRESDWPSSVSDQILDGARARLALPSVNDRAFWDTRDPATVGATEARAQAFVGTPWPQPTASAYARYWRDGNRTAYEDAAGALRARTSDAVVMALVTADRQWVDEAGDGLTLLCEQSSWCWAAHEVFAAARGETVPDVDEPFLDLGAGETVALVAWADLAIGPLLDERLPGLRRRLRREARVRVIEPFLSRSDWHWLGLDGRLHNWNPWIHGSVLTAALLLIDDSAERRTVVGRCLEGLDRYRRSLPSDGGCDEGAGYWWNGPARLAEAALLLHRASGGTLDLLTALPLDEAARFPMRMDLGRGWRVSFADCQARPGSRPSWHVLHGWARVAGLDDVAAHAAAQRDPGAPDVQPSDGLGRVLSALVDDEWRDAAAGELPLPATVWLPETQVFVAREKHCATDGLVVAAKGGHNDENHNHNDVGSYLVALDSVPVLVDLGQQTYTSISFSPRRYEQTSVRADWHHVPVIGGVTQVHGAQYACRSAEVASSPDRSTLSLDLAGAYPAEAGCREWRRDVSLDRTSPAVVVHDAYRLTDTRAVRMPHVLPGEIVGHRNGLLTVLAPSGRTVDLEWDPQLGPGTLEPEALDDELLSRTWGSVIRRLWIDLPPARSGTFSLRIAAHEHGAAV